MSYFDKRLWKWKWSYIYPQRNKKFFDFFDLCYTNEKFIEYFVSMEMIEKKINRKELQEIADKKFGDLVKAVVDIKREIIMVGGELHSDEEAKLLDYGSEQNDLWGINLYPANTNEDFIEFASVINIRPSVGNKSRSINDPKVRKKIIDIVNKLIEKN